MFILGSLESAYTGLPILVLISLRAKIDRKSAISLQRGHFDLKFQVEGGRPTPVIFARVVRQKETLSRLSPSEVLF